MASNIPHNKSIPSTPDNKNKKQLFPNCWDDDIRMNALFSPFREKNLNPVNYENKLKFWKDLIKQYCIDKGCADITVKELRLSFERNGKMPHCLETVITDMLNTGELERKNDFLEPPQHTWRCWATNLLIKKPVKWGFNKVKDRIVTTNPEEVQYIVRDAVDNHCQKLLKHFEGKIVTMADVISKSSELEVNAEGISLAIHSLNCKQKVYINKETEDNDDGQILLKFSTIQDKVQPISHVEYSIHNLEKTENVLIKIVEKIEMDANNEEKMAKEYLLNKKRQLAKNCLRKRNLLLKNLEKRASCLENIQIMLDRIHGIQHDTQILEVYKVGTKSLQSALSGSGITPESVDDALNEMKEIIDLHDEVQSALGGGTLEDDLELENELAKLLDTHDNDGNDNKGNVTDLSQNDAEIMKRLEGLKVTDNSFPEVDQKKILSQDSM